MKKLSLIFVVAIMVAVIVSCNKKDDVVNPEKQYANWTTGGSVVAQIGDMDELKSAPIPPSVGGYKWKINRYYLGSWGSLTGDEFLPGSAPYNDWHTANSNPVFIAAGSGQQFNLSFCPTLPIEIIAKVTTGNTYSESTVAYAGITQLAAPTVNSFPCPVRCIRFGSRARLNAKELTDLPGYTNWSFTLEYVANTINKDATITATNSTQGTGWFNYIYAGSGVTTTTTAGVAAVDGDRTIVDDLNFMMSGTYTNNDGTNGVIGSNLMKLTIFYDATSVVKYVSVPPLGKSMKYVLHTTRVGSYNSANFNPSEIDVLEEIENINVN